MSATVKELLAERGRSFSFEFFPPKTDEGEQQLWRAIEELRPLAPTFVSVTYGAGGGTRDRTIRITQRIARESGITAAAHLTCVGSTVEELRAIVRQIGDAGIRNVMALRGDPPGGPRMPWTATPGGLTHADELVALIKAEGDFCVGVAAFPEKHPEAPDFGTDVKHLIGKFAAGADFAVTQFFFHAADYFDLVEAVRAQGCDAPIIPGIMPVTNVTQIKRMAELSGAEFPGDLAARLHAVEDDAEAVRRIGVEVATDLCRELLDGGAPGIHFMTLNRSTATREIYESLGL
jgi:methylenetetrahydrofolate reductase (NADPH)